MRKSADRWFSCTLWGSSLLAALLWTTVTYADTDVRLQTIIVTAEKRPTDIERTPAAVTALHRTDLEQHQVRDLSDLRGLVSSFEMGEAQGIAQIAIRGIGSSTFLPGTGSAVAVNENEVNIGRPIAQETGLFDVQDIDVVRGPQGTLYGRNAAAGAVNITTARPTEEFSGYANATVGNYGEVRLESAIGGPVDKSDTLLVRFAGFYERHDGYGTNLVTHRGIDNKNAYGMRATVVYKPTSNLKGTLIAEYSDENDRQGAFHYFAAGGLSGLSGTLGAPPLFVIDGGYAPSSVRDVANGIDPYFHLPVLALTGIAQWTNGPFSIKSITGYRHQTPHFTYDLDGGSTLNLYELEGEPANQISEELQFHYQTDQFHLISGLYYFNEHDNSSPAQVVGSTGLITFFFGIPYPSPGFVTVGNLNANLTTESEAIFGEGTYDLTRQLSVTAGLRYSAEKDGIASRYAIDDGLGGAPLFPSYPGTNPLIAANSASKTFYSLTPKFGLQYQLEPDTFLYASYSQGFKSGGFDTGVTDPIPFRPEKLTDYEIGLKTTQLNHRLRFNLSGFYYDFEDLQVTQVVGVSVQTGNAATARDYGAEAELIALPTAALELDATAAWTHARYVAYTGPDPARPLLPTASFSGKALNNAPDYQATLGAQYSWYLGSGTLSARGEGDYSSKFYFGPGNEAELSQSAFVKGNLFITYKSDSLWELTAYVKNVANTTTKTSALVVSPLALNPVVGSLAPPRLFGLAASRRF